MKPIRKDEQEYLRNYIADKFRDKQRLKAYRAYLAYEEGRNTWIK